MVLAAVTDDTDDWRYELLQDNLRVLREATDARGRRFEVDTVPMPAIMEITEDEAWGVDSAEGSIPRRPGDKTAASYLNFLIVNGGMIMPVFDDPNDDVASADLEALFPDRRGRHRAGPRDRARRRQRALHHAAAAGGFRRRSGSSTMSTVSKSSSSKELPGFAALRGRHYFTDQDYSREELLGLLDLAVALKALYRRRPLTPFLEGRTLAMIFEHPSTRTRISFEAGMTELGGHAQYLRPGEIHLGGHETVADTARVISRLVDAIMARTAFHATLAELVEYATVPVINGLTDDYDHPVQSMTDALTIFEHLGTVDRAHLRLRRQVRRRHGHVGGAHHDAPRQQHDHGGAAGGADDARGGGARARQLRASPAPTLTLTDDAVAAVAQADVVFTVGWWWMQPEDEKQELRRILGPYQVNEALWAHAKPGAKFMHCLPAIRGEEMTDAILDAPFSIILDEAENRKHFQKALLLALIGIDELPADPELQPIARALLR